MIKEDSGTYTCMVNNKYGQDMVSHELIVNGPPDPPEIQITSQTTDTVTIKLRPRNPEDKTPVHGYKLHYKPEFGDWDTAQVIFLLNPSVIKSLYYTYFPFFIDSFWL